MSFEVEIKFRVADHGTLRARLLDLGAEEGLGIEYEDVYLSHPSRDFAQTDEALRLRRLGDVNRITYKGFKRGGSAKTREEIEIPYADGPDPLAGMLRLFECLGFRQVAVVRKVRTAFRIRHSGRDLEVALDEAGGLGIFAEVETIAEDGEGIPAAQEAVLALAQELRLEVIEPRSYLKMTLEG